MAPPDRAEIEILKLTLDPPQRFMEENYSSVTTMEVDKWFTDSIAIEKQKIPQNQIVRFYEWNIKSDNANLFEADGHCYDKIVVILTDDGAHWMFYSNMPARKPILGQGCLSVSYCGCCLNTQYTQVIESIKASMAKQGSRI